MRAEDVLPDQANRAEFDGVDVRKGTVAAFLHNARVWSDPGTSAEDRSAVEADMIEAVPALRAVGLFDVLTVRDAKLAALIAERD